MTLPGGDNLTVDGFMTIDDTKFNNLANAAVLELHRSGALGLVYAHLASLNHMGAMIERHASRRAAAS